MNELLSTPQLREPIPFVHGTFSDFVVTVPMNFKHPAAPGKRGLAAWIAEGDAAGDEWSGEEWVFSTYGGDPSDSVVLHKSRLYIVCEGRLRGYAPITGFAFSGSGLGHVRFLRRGGAVACTIPDRVVGFRGWRRRWWDRSDEIPFPNWKTP